MAAPMEITSHDDFPIEIRDRLEAFDNQLTQVESDVKKFITTPLSEIHEKLSLIEKAKVDLITAYSINSLFWTYLVARGENPREHPVKQELVRIQAHMKRAKEIEQDLKDKEKSLRVDKAAAKRLVVGTLGQQLKEDERQKEAGTAGDAVVNESVTKAKKNLWKKAHKKTAPPATTPPPSEPVEETSPHNDQKRKSREATSGGKKKKKR